MGQLLRAAEACTTERQRLEAELWREVEGLVATQQTRKYDRAVRILVDLRDLAARGKGGDFGLRVEELRQAQAKMPSFLERLRKAGL